MSKPIRLTYDQRRKVILKSAIGVFSESNYRAATIDEIAEKAGVTAPMIYKFFDSKEELFIEVLSLINGRTHEVYLNKKLIPNEPIKTKAELAQLIEGVMLPYFQNMKVFHKELKVFYQAVSEIDNDQVKSAIKKTYFRTVEFYKKLHKHAVDSGVLSPDIDLEALGYDYLGFIIQENAYFLAGIYDEERTKAILSFKINSWINK